MQSNPRILVNLLVILVILVNTSNIRVLLHDNHHQYYGVIGFGISDLRDPSPSQILGTSSRFSEDFLGRERALRRIP